MRQHLEYYGELPTPMGLVYLEEESAELCFVQYLPIKMKGSLELHIPDNLLWVKPLLDCINVKQVDKYVYLTVRHQYGNSNRGGWHCDGFGSDDVNYIWYTGHGTHFIEARGVTLPKGHKESMELMEYIAKGQRVHKYPAHTLLKLTQSNIHRVNPDPFYGLRTFVKVSISDDKYNLKGNAHNYMIDYKWDMKPRGVERNDPIQED